MHSLNRNCITDMASCQVKQCAKEPVDNLAICYELTSQKIVRQRLNNVVDGLITDN